MILVEPFTGEKEGPYCIRPFFIGVVSVCVEGDLVIGYPHANWSLIIFGKYSNLVTHTIKSEDSVMRTFYSQRYQKMGVHEGLS